jgi:hypothetical protein
MDLAVFNFSEKITCFALYLVLWTEFSTCQSTNLRTRWLDLFCNYHIQCVCNHCHFSVLPHFWHLQNFIVNLDTIMPLTNTCILLYNKTVMDLFITCWICFVIDQTIRCWPQLRLGQYSDCLVNIMAYSTGNRGP